MSQIPPGNLRRARRRAVPAGLTAAIRLARFRRRVVARDKGERRLATIPCSRDHAGFPGGVRGGARVVPPGGGLGG